MKMGLFKLQIYNIIKVVLQSLLKCIFQHLNLAISLKKKERQRFFVPLLLKMFDQIGNKSFLKKFIIQMLFIQILSKSQEELIHSYFV